MHAEHFSGAPARYAPGQGEAGALSPPLPPQLLRALERQCGVGARLYTHQAAAITAVRAGSHVALSTPTASGKSLCYNVPVVEALLRWRDEQQQQQQQQQHQQQQPAAGGGHGGPVALYLFPTKALAQDQLRALQQLLGGMAADTANAASAGGET